MSHCVSITALLAAGILIGCAADTSDPVAAIDGEMVYRQPLAEGNTFACATCHALEDPAADGFLRAGHAIGDAVNRASYKNGQHSELLDAVNTCVEEWMLAPPWNDDDPNWLALQEFLGDVAPAGPAPLITIDITAPPTSLVGGDATSGQTLFNESCALCHGQEAIGTERAPPLVGSLLDADYIATRIRTSGLTNSGTYDGLTGGRMPFWGADRLSDEQLIDLVAFVQGNEPDLDNPAPTPGDDEPDRDDCAADHPRVGQTADLSTLAHGVSGTARIVDNCTIAIEDFSFDGNGIDVRVYGGLNDNYDDGFAMTGDLRRSGGYSDEVVFATLPEGRSLDDVDGVSIWCVAVGVNFGDASFPSL